MLLCAVPYGHCSVCATHSTPSEYFGLTPLSGKFDVDGSLEEHYHADAEPKDIKGSLFLALFSIVASNETCQPLLL